MNGLNRLRDEATALPRWITLATVVVLLLAAGALGWRALTSASDAKADHSASGVASPPAPR